MPNNCLLDNLYNHFIFFLNPHQRICLLILILFFTFYFLRFYFLFYCVFSITIYPIPPSPLPHYPPLLLLSLSMRTRTHVHWFLQRGDRGRKRERNIDLLPGDWTHNLSMHPDRWSNPKTFCSTGRHSSYPGYNHLNGYILFRQVFVSIRIYLIIPLLWIYRYSQSFMTPYDTLMENNKPFLVRVRE